MRERENDEYTDEEGVRNAAEYSDFTSVPEDGPDLPANESTIERIDATYRSLNRGASGRRSNRYRSPAARRLDERPGVAKDAYRRVRTVRNNAKTEASRVSTSTNVRDAAHKQFATPLSKSSAFPGGGSAAIKTTGRAAARFLIMPAVFAYGAQLVLGLIAFGLVGVHVVIQEMTSGGGVVATVTGWLLEAGKTVVGWFADIPGFDEMGMFFWFFAFLVALCVFLGYILFFHFIGISFMDSVTATIILFVCIVLCYVIPIFPGALIWVVYVVAKDTVKSAREIAGV